jgi:WD40 repeat protein/tetratricopeptide (TPR) repeat protein/predicted Ser/Thr protein kinase
MTPPTPADASTHLRLAELVRTLDPAQLLDRLREDQHACWLIGTPVPAEEYVGLLPPSAIEDALVLIWGEVEFRLRLGESPDATEYAARFPTLAGHIARQFELGRALAGWTGSTMTLDDGPRAVAAEVPSGYEIAGELGRGGMGVVYKARQVALNRTVALKMMWADGPGSVERAARFRQEAELAARLQHPNIAQVYEFGRRSTPEDGRTFLAMEYVEGRTLAQQSGGVPQPVRDAARLVETLATAVQYAHDRGVVHRDLKPSNVLVSTAGVLKIVDFGLAKELAEGPAHTGTGQLLGTPAYMAPEQAAGHNDRVGPPTDVWALGAILYELLTGRPPFRGDSLVTTLNRILHDPPTPIAALRPEVPRDLQTVCLKCLEKDPGRRYASAAALADDLGRFLGGRSVVARPVSAWQRGWRWCRRNRPLAAALAAVAGLLLAVAVVSTVAAVQLSREADRAGRAERDKTIQLFHAVFNDARSHRRAGRRVDALERLREATRLARELDLPPETVHDLRDEALACLTLAELKQTNALPADEALGRLPPEEAAKRLALLRETNLIAVAPDLTTLLCRHPEGGVALYDAETLDVLRRLDAPTGLDVASHRTDFSPDGRYLVMRAFDGRRRAVVWDLTDPSPRPRYEFAGYALLDLPFSRTGKLLAVHDGTEIVLYETASGHATTRFEGMNAQLEYLGAFDPKGERLAVAEQTVLEEDGVSVFIVDRTTGERSRRIAAGGAALGGLTWNDDGRLLAVSWNSVVRVYDAAPDPMRLVSVLTGHQNNGVFSQFVPGTGYLLSSGWEGRLRLWDAVSGRQLVEVNGGLRQLTRDGSAVAAFDGRRVIRYAIRPAAECRVLHHGTVGGSSDWVERVANVSFDATSTVLATGGYDGVRFWDPARGVELTTSLPLPGGGTGRFVGPDNRAFLTHGPSGCLWWPRAPAAGAWAFGPPRPLKSTGVNANAITPVTADGEWVAYSTGATPPMVVVRHTADPTRRAVFGPYGNVEPRSLSPDGSRVAVGTWNGRDAIVWDAPTGRIVHRTPGGSFDAAISPDGRRLATREFHGEFQLRDADTGVVVLRFRDGEGQFAFTADSRLLAVGLGPGRVRLFDAETGGPLVTLETPDRLLGLWHLAFSPDGRYLAAATSESSAVVWDLVALRRGLAAVGLEWVHDTPPPVRHEVPDIRFTDAEAVADLKKLLATERARLRAALVFRPFDPQIHFELGRWAQDRNELTTAFVHLTLADLTGPERPAVSRYRFSVAARLGAWSVAHADADRLTRLRPEDPDSWWFRAAANRRLGHADAARADLERMGRALGDSPVRLNHFAWRLVQTEPDLRDAEQGVRLARRAVELAGDQPAYWNTLGVGLYRTGDYQGAVEALDRSRSGGGRPAEVDLYPLAICLHKLGRHEDARDAYRRATRFTVGRSDLPSYIVALRAEAEAVLGPPPADGQ